MGVPQVRKQLEELVGQVELKGMIGVLARLIKEVPSATRLRSEEREGY